MPEEGCGLVQLMCLCENMLAQVWRCTKHCILLHLEGVNLEVHKTLYIVALEGEGEGELHYCFSRLGLHNGEKLEQFSNRLRLPPIFLKHLKKHEREALLLFLLFEEHGWDIFSSI